MTERRVIDRSERCAVQAGLRGDPMLGSAFPAGRLLIVEQPGPWGRAGLLDSRFDRAVAHRLVARLSRAGIRVLAMRRPGRAVADGLRRWVAVDCRPGREALYWGRFDNDGDVLDLDVAALLDGARRAGKDCGLEGADLPDDRGNAGDDQAPLYAVCAHGTHDVCCAINGRPVAAALEAIRPGQVWECSHVGGDRFAANVLVLPSGMLYGRVAVSEAQALVDATDNGTVLEQNARGRVGFPSDVQAAMVLVHRERPGVKIADVRPIGGRRVSDELSEVRLAVGESTVDVQVRVAAAATAWLTCQAGQPSSANVYLPMTMVDVPTAP